VWAWASRGGEAVLRPDSTRVRAQLELEVGEDPDRRAPPVSEREKRRARGLAGPREELAGWAGWAVREKGRGRKKGRLGLGRKGEKREEKERKRVGRAQREKKGEIKLHSNAFEFEFEI
jgi:hypothetical protein